MTKSPPAIGLLLDVDGPIASPITRTVPAQIIRDLNELAKLRVPIAFITGRSLAFLQDEVVAPLIDGGIPPAVRMFGACEKGAVRFPITAAGIGAVETDDGVALPVALVTALRQLVEDRFSDSMFFDQTKQVMASVEQRPDVSSRRYGPAQREFNRAAFELCVRSGIGVRMDDVDAPDGDGRTPFRIESTIISTDIESVTLDKDSAAQQALEFFAEGGQLPQAWRSVGDSRSDYLMADQLHSTGWDVAHIDVRPADGIPDRPYPVIVMDELIHEEAGAAFLSHWVEQLSGLTRNEDRGRTTPLRY